jgi:hypothetical protein
MNTRKEVAKQIFKRFVNPNWNTNKGRIINYPGIRKIDNPVAHETSRYINSNPEILFNRNRNKVIADAINKTHLEEKGTILTTRKGSPVNRNVISKTITQNLGYPKLPKLSITENPRAADKIEELFTADTNIKSPAIKKELIKIDSKYKDLTPQSITDYLKRVFPGQRTTISTAEENARRNLKTQIKAELDDPVASAGIERLRSSMGPFFSKIVDKSQSKNVLEGGHPAQLVNRVQPEGKTFITTPFRNSAQNKLENEAKRLMEQKNAIVATLSPNDSASMSMLKNINNQIETVSDKMSRLGLESKLKNEATGKFQYFGNLYPNVSTLYKSVKGPPGGIGPSVTGRGFGFAQGGLVSLLKDKSLQKMAKNLIPKQFSILKGGFNGSF